MELSFLCTKINTFVSLLALFCPCNFIQSPTDKNPFIFLKDPIFSFDSDLQFLPSTNVASLDYGRLSFNLPSAVLKPKSSAEISSLLSFLSSSSVPSPVSVAARGAGHSIHGQAQATDGIVIEMNSLPSSIEIHEAAGEEEGFSYADVSGGALWIELLEESLKFGLAPRSWTDYLYLSIGGTLSNAGISGQTFKYGPQISNVLQLEVVNGKGEIVICSEDKNAEIFYAVLGGLGQFGIITRARVLLQDAPQKVKWVRAFYDDFQSLLNDQELLISMPEKVDYVEGFMVLNENSLHTSSMAFPSQMDFISELRKNNSKAYFCIEFAVHDYGQPLSDLEDDVVKEIAEQLSFMSPFLYAVEVSYYEFLNRVRREEMSLRRRGQWEVPHPWLNMFVPKSGIEEFKELFLQSISCEDFEGLILVYPFLTDKWNLNTSAVLPETLPESTAQVVYAVGLLQSVDPSRCDARCLAEILERQRRLVTVAVGRIGAKQYLSRQASPEHWRAHFGWRWERFEALKSRFDPLALLAPGQGIFSSQNPSS